jgi:xanthine dehydrogenase small subunit
MSRSRGDVAAPAARVPVSRAIRYLLDGEVRTVSGIAPTRTVLQHLREDLGRVGTKEGCAEGDCGACTVVLAELGGRRIRYRAVNSCIQFLPALDGRALLTVESLARREGPGPGAVLHPVQQALAESHGTQCGFCTPGFVMSLFALYKTDLAPDRTAITDALAGNLCRCTGYRPIIDAATAMYGLGRALPGGDQDWLRAPAGSPSPTAAVGETTLAARLRGLRRRRGLVLRHPEGTFHAPRTVAELAALRQRLPDARLLAGGTDVGLWVTKQHRRLGDLIAVGEVAELRRTVVEHGLVVIGAAMPLTDAFAAIVRPYPELRELFRRFGSPPVRNAGTLGGNVANGSPIGDSMPPLIALGARVRLRRGADRRELPLEDLYLGYQETALRAGEFVEHVAVPLRAPGLNLAAYKVSKRFDQDISAVCGAFALAIDAGVIRSARVAFGGLAATPKRARGCEAALEGRPWSEATCRRAAAALETDYAPISDLRASAGYRMGVARNLLRRFYLERDLEQGPDRGRALPDPSRPTRVTDLEGTPG